MWARLNKVVEDIQTFDQEVDGLGREEPAELLARASSFWTKRQLSVQHLEWCALKPNREWAEYHPEEELLIGAGELSGEIVMTSSPPPEEDRETVTFQDVVGRPSGGRFLVESIPGDLVGRIMAEARRSLNCGMELASVRSKLCRLHVVERFLMSLTSEEEGGGASG